MFLSDGVFNFLDTFEERSLKLKVLDHEAGEEKQRLEKSLEEVIFSDEIYCLDFKGGLTYKVVTRWPVPRWSQGGHKVVTRTTVWSCMYMYNSRCCCVVVHSQLD